MADICVIYCPFPSRAEALAAASALVDQRLIACANVVDSVTSVYRWEGKIMQESEALLIAKTSSEQAENAVSALKALHSYELPSITVLPVSGGFEPFLAWVKAETAS